jgi:hypothetical protein
MVINRSEIEKIIPFMGLSQETGLALQNFGFGDFFITQLQRSVKPGILL